MSEKLGKSVFTFNYDTGSWINNPPGYGHNDPPREGLIEVGISRVGIDIGHEQDYIFSNPNIQQLLNVGPDLLVAELLSSGWKIRNNGMNDGHLEAELLLNGFQKWEIGDGISSWTEGLLRPIFGDAVYDGNGEFVAELSDDLYAVFDALETGDRKNILLVGRHAPDFGNLDINVVKQLNDWNFAVTYSDVWNDLVNLEAIASKAGAGTIVLQAVPGQVAATLAKMYKAGETNLSWGVVVSVPGDRPAGVVSTFAGETAQARDAIVRAVKAANPRAKIEINGEEVTVTVDPPMRFKFSHIEWL